MAEWLYSAGALCWRAFGMAAYAAASVVVAFVCLVLLFGLPWFSGDDWTCEQCGHHVDEVRTADRAETIYYRCKECGHVGR